LSADIFSKVDFILSKSDFISQASWHTT
jgi:hypothetical protein